MNTFPQCRQRGIALVIVLCFLVLISTMMLAFLSIVTVDSQATESYTRSAAARQLADSAVNLVMAQVKEATTNGPTVAWASQPGMIRTYDTSGQPAAAYKLYSSDTMKLNGAVNLAAEVAALGDWAKNTATFVDLNSPATDRDGEKVWPIVHPLAGEPAAGDNTDQLQGFKIAASAPASPLNAAPMPVRWLYVLSEGQIVAPTGSGATATVAGASKTNPIVGRIAFWADDESSKVNINTAAGDEWPSSAVAGAYWDLPRTQTDFDKLALAKFQPAQAEFQRYPGHPATVYLSAVFPKLKVAQIGAIAARVQKGGSEGGTKVPTGKVPTDADRLYASIDELIFDPKRADQPITKERLERARFFLTANSRAPELNLFNQPRVSVWPVHSEDSLAARTAFDRVIAFCSRLGADDYIFTRTDADSKTTDYSGRNVKLYNYLQRLTSEAIPGYGGKFSTKYGADRDQILTEIFDYIRSTNLFDDNLETTPGVYPTKGREYTDPRRTLYSVDRGHGQVTPIEIGTTKGFGRFYTLSEIGLQFICTADAKHPVSNQVTGANKNRTLETALTGDQKRIEALLIMSPFSPSQGWTAIRPDMQITVEGLDKLKINGAELGFPNQGTIRQSASAFGVTHGRTWGGAPDFRMLLINDLGTSRLTRKLPLRGVMAAESGLNEDNVYPFVSKPITVTGATMAMTEAILKIKIYTNKANNPAPSDATLVQTLNVKIPAGTFPVPDIVKTGTSGEVADKTPVTETFPEHWWTFGSAGVTATGKAITDPTVTLKGRLAMVFENPGNTWKGPQSGCLIRAEDTVRTVVVKHADHRLVAGVTDVADDVFVKHPQYDKGTRMAHSFRIGLNFGYIQGADDPIGGKAKLINTDYNWSVQPYIPAGLTVTEPDIFGDWDTAFSNIQDGAYINKPDEGQGGTSAYYDSGLYNIESAGPTLFSPNRQIPSAGMFGSLPSQLKAKVPWRTLLFRPDTSGAGHIGAKSPKDHLLLDFFWMPMVEPYAISEPFSTAGKINLNYQIAPFTYLERTTALRALLRSERVMAVPTKDGSVYKTGGGPASYRNEIDAEETLKQCLKRFDDDKDLFRSASEICDLFLVPKGQSLSGMGTFWAANRLTGDNARERPYTTLYPRLTTKSNTYTVHLRVQTLRQVPSSTAGMWTEGKDIVTGEYRGSSVIERYIDLEGTLPDFTTAASESVDKHTKLRTLMTRKFTP